jgi:D-alanyl-D-alanine carboxypeptidase/D-alanyl-D-alanine carboxypeptidase (penicillin-binding protein 5/6)
MKAPNSATVKEETSKLLDYAFKNFKLTPLAASEASDKNAFPILFEDEEALISDVSSPLSVSDTSLVLPGGISYDDLTRKVSLSPSVSFTTGDNVIGEVKFYYADNFVGSAKIIYHSETDTIVVPSPTPTPTVTPIPAAPEGNPDSAEVSNGTDTDTTEQDNRPFIIGIIVGIVILEAGLYIVLVEIPYRQKRKAYQRKYGSGKHKHKDESQAELIF